MGRLLVWHNYGEDGRVEPRSLHAGCDVAAGEKYVANIWLSKLGGRSMLSLLADPEPDGSTDRTDQPTVPLAAEPKLAVPRTRLRGGAHGDEV